jgi:hypothetical protein
MMNQDPSLGFSVDEITPYLMPLLRRKGKEPLEAVGTAFLVEAHGAYFLVSAGHVLEQPRNLVYFYSSDHGPIEIVGHRVVVGVRPNGVDPMFDIGVVRLAGAITPPYERWASLPLSTLRCQHSNEEGAAFNRAAGPYFFLGFPVSQNRINPAKNTLRPKAYGLYDLQLAPDGDVPARYSNDVHLFLQMPPGPIIKGGEHWTFPAPHGLSGSPIWYRDELGAAVVGIAIEYDKNKKMLVATDIGSVIWLIEYAEKQYQQAILLDAAAYVPKS